MVEVLGFALINKMLANILFIYILKHYHHVKTIANLWNDTRKWGLLQYTEEEEGVTKVKDLNFLFLNTCRF